jgi:hypothetical protein
MIAYDFQTSAYLGCVPNGTFSVSLGYIGLLSVVGNEPDTDGGDVISGGSVSYWGGIELLSSRSMRDRLAIQETSDDSNEHDEELALALWFLGQMN